MIVDFHTHIFPPWLKERRQLYIERDSTFAELYKNPEAKIATAEDLLIEMEEDGIEMSVAGALLASIGLEVLGLGPAHLATLGQIIFWVDFYNALLRGAWWWWGPPILVVIVLFFGLFLASVALDEIANPRLKTRV